MDDLMAQDGCRQIGQAVKRVVTRLEPSGKVQGQSFLSKSSRLCRSFDNGAASASTRRFGPVMRQIEPIPVAGLDTWYVACDVLKYPL